MTPAAIKKVETTPESKEASFHTPASSFKFALPTPTPTPTPVGNTQALDAGNSLFGKAETSFSFSNLAASGGDNGFKGFASGEYYIKPSYFSFRTR